ncbi:NADH-ubiquinone oxidoreductase-F iron-sulfur binding region domain-containing protein [Nocardia sp. NPDC057353]|uniref:NADH-ubiquinone oxidoreductase-F iron-sulfur binding region domain-containing protein n=1 Tax=Nocardia sp. NPDC057353 TaxID=3346104 RepID=UPI00362883BC
MQDIFERSSFRVGGPAPGLEPRLLRAGGADLAGYLAAGGYRQAGDPEALLEQVRRSGLLGRGGAGFPLAVKLAGVRKRSGGGAVVLANGEEGEPASVKDKWLLRHRPHLVLDGVRLAAGVVGAGRAVVYLSDRAAARSVDAALTETDAAGIEAPPIELVLVDPTYVAGEETAAVRAVDGGPALPSDKPPRPFERGVAGLPTVVSNVETLAHLPFVHAHGGEAFRAVGTEPSPGTFLATVTGGGRPAALYELPHGLPFTELLALHGVSPDAVRGALTGGYFAGMVDRGILDATLEHHALRALGGGMGCGAFALITTECPVAVAAAVLEYFDRQNAGQCGSCWNGTAAMAAAAGALRDGRAGEEDVARLRRWSVVLRGRGACGTLDGATNAAATLLARFAPDVAAHLSGTCPTCSDGPYRAERPFEVDPEVIP